MAFGIELFFDLPTEKFLRKLGRRLEDKGVPSLFSISGGEPHVALAVFEKGNLPAIKESIKKLAARFSPFELRLSSAGSFPGREGVLFLAPVVTFSLLEIHRRVHEFLGKSAAGSRDYYKPSWWVPHCTLGLKLSPAQLAKGFSHVKKTKFGKVGRYTRLGLVEVIEGRSLRIRPLFTIPLKPKK